MSEDDLGDLALESGQSILQIFGATAAGLSIEAVGLEEEEPTESTPALADDAVVEATQKTLKSLEEQLTEEFNNERSNAAFDPNLEAIFQPVEQVVGQASIFDTNSEIQYERGKFNHDPTFNDDGSVQLDRDLQIDLLKLENLGGDDPNDQDLFGSIYISDWSSQGSTTTQVRD